MSKDLEKQSNSVETRFASTIIDKLKTTVGLEEVTISKEQALLAQKYYFGIDRALKTAEEHRLKRKPSDPPITWNNINMEVLYQDMADNLMAGLDPTLPNHINFIPYLGKDGKYTLTQIIGYVGYKIRHLNQGIPGRRIKKDIIRLVYSNEKFIPKYSNGMNDDSFEHIPSENPFDKGEVVGGYFYKIYEDGSTKLTVVPLESILKRRPKTAAAEFWGGEKDEWAYGKKTGKKVKVEGWADEMMLKTLIIMCYKEEDLDSSRTFQRATGLSDSSEVVDSSYEDVTEPIETISIDDKVEEKKEDKSLEIDF